ncbi:MAG: VOC family protein [Micropruina sp.]|nr:VOC family protein [Micropruina sp.]
MDPRVNFITIAVADVAAARRFYVDGLGWPPVLDTPGVVMIRLGPTLVLSLWAQEEFEAEVAPIRRGNGVPGFTLAHNLPSANAVDEVLDAASAAGAGHVSPGRHSDWGGYSGYFADPDGVRWEVAYNPGPLGTDLMEASGLV